MPRKNKKGTTYLGLGLEDKEEKHFKDYLKEKDKSGHQVLRLLIRKLLKGEITL